MIKVLIVDDHQIVRQGLQTLLENQEHINIAAEAANGKEALDILAKDEIDLVILDINMPVMDGIACCSQIKSLYPDIKIIALSMYSEMSFLEKMFEKGANGYLLKSCSKAEIIDAITSVYNGNEFIGSELKESYTNHEKASLLIEKTTIPKISKREKEVLHLISEEMTTAEIAERLFLAVATVETHRKNLLRKFELKNTAGLMRFAFENRLLS